MSPCPDNGFVPRIGGSFAVEHMEPDGTQKLLVLERLADIPAAYGHMNPNTAEMYTMSCLLTWLLGHVKSRSEVIVLHDSRNAVTWLNNGAILTNPMVLRHLTSMRMVLNKLHSRGVNVSFFWYPNDLMKKSILQH